jgi:2'-5' RNA ligase
MSDTIRAFIAIELPEKIIASISRVQESIRSQGFKVRWVRPQNIHLTLKFLGDIKAAETKAVEKVVLDSVVGSAPISMTARGLGVFPGIKRPRVIWVGIGGQTDELIELQQTLDKKLATIGFSRERRPFKGHLTMGRVKAKIDSKRLLEAMKAFDGFETEPFVADRLILFQSDLKPSGAVYAKLMEAPLVL